MIDYEQILNIAPYSLDKKQKGEFLTDVLFELTEHHAERCAEYGRLMKALDFDARNKTDYYDIPYLPVRLFKEMDLKSVPDNEVIKTMTSSGTTGQSVSKIYLDRQTSALQTKTLAKIVSSYIGKERGPMIIIDSPSVIKDRNMFSARGAGILGFSVFGRDKIYALDENMELNVPALEEFLARHKGEQIFLFGFTFIIWQHFYKKLAESGRKLDLTDGVIIHGGGWKKLAEQAVDSGEFRQRLKSVCNISKVFEYYGMVEQTGTVYMECQEGHLHASVFSDVIVRRANDFGVADFGEKGILQVVSVLPTSYPGHSLLTEDEGVILGEDDCPCGRKGKYFKITGRIKNAEIRGCSDTYAAKFR